MAIITWVAAGFMVGQYIYHRWIEDPDVINRPPREFQIPRNDPGSTIPLIFGRVRVRAPILAWCSTPFEEEGSVLNTYPTGTYAYQLDMFFILGIGMTDGLGENNVHALWSGDTKFTYFGEDEGVDAIAEISHPGTAEPFVGGLIQWYGGNPSQEHVNSSGVAVTGYGGELLGWGWPVALIPGHHGYISVFLHAGGGSHWYIGGSPSLAPYSFEVSSYQSAYSYPGVGIYGRVGQDSNPINALYDLLVAKFGKLGLSTSLIDQPTFSAAATKIYGESHGYSRVIEDSGEAEAYIQEILEQIDGVLRENPTTGKVEIKLIRNDYDPNTIPHITKANCEEIQNFAIGGWQNLPNKVRVVFTDRSNNYIDNSVIAHNQANAVGGDGIVREQVIRMPGVCYKELADAIAGRELAARSRPVIKMRAIVDRSFIRVMQGDAVKVTWTDPDIQGLIFRVANVDRGTLGDGNIALDLIQDYFYVHRNQPPKQVDLGKLGTEKLQNIKL
jgi:hypothetical protein